MRIPLLEVKGLAKAFPVKTGIFQKTRFVHALNGIDLTVFKGEILGIVGESGCGKSTAGRCILRLLEPTAGTVKLEGTDILNLSKKDFHRVTRDIQMVFQNTYDTLNPKLTIRKILSEPLVAHHVPQEVHEEIIRQTIGLVGLKEEHLSRYPHEFSGGQRQRIGIARAIMLRPKLIIADEPVSALDVSIQSQIINLFKDLQEQFGLTYIFISHDLHVIKHISDRVVVMYLGEVVEMADRKTLFQNPLHPYTRALLTAIPKSDPDEKKDVLVLQGEIPSPSSPPAGCKFHPRCSQAMDRCKSVRPKLQAFNGGDVSCHLYQ